MKITLPEQHVILAPNFNLSSVLGIEQHTIGCLDRPDVGTHSNDAAPGEPASDCHCRGDQDSAAAASLARLIVGRDQHAIMQHPDGKCTLIQIA